MSITAFRGKYFFLSNFYEISVKYKGILYHNTEAAFQAQKCINESDKIKFSNLNPSEAKKLGRRVNLRSDWEDVKINEMYNIVKEKFIQNSDLLKKLIDTKDTYLEEGNTWGDKIWGTVDGSGNNYLGKILMKVRDELKETYNGN